MPPRKSGGNFQNKGFRLAPLVFLRPFYVTSTPPPPPSISPLSRLRFGSRVRFPSPTTARNYTRVIYNLEETVAEKEDDEDEDEDDEDDGEDDEDEGRRRWKWG